MTGTDAVNFTPASALFDGWADDLLSGTAPVRYPVGRGAFDRIDFGPGRVLLLGGRPGGGKTALAMQWVMDALRLTPALRAVVCNVEMHPRVLLDRQVPRVSGVPLDVIRSRTLTPEQRDAVRKATAELRPLAARLTFVNAPYSLPNVAAAADATAADVIVIDYVQRLRPPPGVREKREQIDAIMDAIRQFAAAGKAVLVVAAVTRSKDTKGRNSYESLSLASFRGSGELEFACDDAFILSPGAAPADPVTLAHLKSRYGECADVTMRFDRPHQRFIPWDDAPTTTAQQPKQLPKTPKPS